MRQKNLRNDPRGKNGFGAAVRHIAGSRKRQMAAPILTGILWALAASGHVAGAEELVVESMLAATQCGIQVRKGGIITFDDENGDGMVDFGGEYRLEDVYDLLSVLWTGIDKFNDKDCDSDLRRYLADHWNEEFLHHLSCETSVCDDIHHLFRPEDSADIVTTFLDRIGVTLPAGEAFCNGSELEDGDPIRRPCTPSEQVCGLDGTLGLVLPVSTQIAYDETITNSAPCVKGRFEWKAVSFSMRPMCDDGALSIFGLCLVPVDADGDCGCINPDDNFSIFTPLNYDTRAANRVLRSRTGTVLEMPSGQDVVAGFHRLHATTPEGASCNETVASSQIGCLTKAGVCSQGLADERALAFPTAVFKDISPNESCPELTWLYLGPTEQAVGFPITLQSDARDADGDPLVLNWQATPAGNTFADPTARETLYNCESPGEYTITLTITDEVCDLIYDFDVLCFE